MEALSIIECRKHLGAFQSALRKLSHVSKIGTEVVQTSIKNLNTSQRVLLYSVTAGGIVLYFLGKFLKRSSRAAWTKGSLGGKNNATWKSDAKKKLRASIRRSRKLSAAPKSTSAGVFV